MQSLSPECGVPQLKLLVLPEEGKTSAGNHRESDALIKVGT